MRDAEVEMFRHRLEFEVDRLARIADGLDASTANWRPAAPGANSVLVLITHALGSLEYLVVQKAAGRAVARSREGEFAAHGDPSGLRARADDVWRRVDAAVADLSPGASSEPIFRKWPFGPWTVRDTLIHAVSHTAEHAGQAELTRDMWLSEHPHAAARATEGQQPPAR